MKRGKQFIKICILLFALFCLCACGNNTTGNTVASSSVERVDTGLVLTDSDSYDSADTSIVLTIDATEKTITFLNLDLGKKYTLSIDGTTRFSDKYGDSISLSQVKAGDIVDITFLRSKKHLRTLQMSTQAWSYENVSRYEINSVRGDISIGSDIYKLTKNTSYFSESNNIELSDLNANDVLSFQGIGTQILSVCVEKGHGYLRLVNDENFVGGWIEVGQTMIRRITADMLLTIPEGSYQVNISNKGGGGIKNVIINRNEETTLDIGDLVIPEPQYGIVLFSMTPSDAELYVDGSVVDTSGPVSLLYGIHQIIARATGYQSITQYIRVGQESAGINVVLESATSTTEDSSSSSSSGSASESSASSSGSVVTTTDYYKVYIDSPEKVEVYVDGNYVGISPCSLKKVAGTHDITLRKNGYETRSYTVQVDSEEKDITYSFVDLIAIQ